MDLVPVPPGGRGLLSTGVQPSVRPVLEATRSSDAWKP